MSNQSEERHDKITAPERLPVHHVQALAMQKAQMKARGARVVDLRLVDSHPVGGDKDVSKEWSYSYRLVQPGA